MLARARRAARRSGRARARVETLLALLGAGRPAVVPRRYDIESLPADLRETATVRAAADALREATDRAEVGCRKDGAAAAWYAESVLRFLCATFGCRVTGVQVTEEGFIAATAEVAGDRLVEVSVTVGPEGTCACKISAGELHSASTAPDARSFERLLKERLTQVGLRCWRGNL